MTKSLKSVKQYVLRLTIGVAAAIFVALVFGHTAAFAAAIYTPSITRTDIGGGSSTTTRTRLDLENTGTTNALSLTVSVFFKNKPTGNTRVTAYDYKRGGSWEKGACFSGFGVCWYGPTAGAHPKSGVHSSTAAFNLPPSGWTLDPIYGLWRQNITATLSSSISGSDVDNWVHFRLKLDDGSAGIIANGGSNNTTNYADWDSTPSTHTPAQNYIFKMATPCGVTSNVNGNITLGDLDSGSWQNNGYVVTVTITDETTGATVSYNGNSYAAMRNDNADFTIGYTFQPGHKYNLKVANMAPMNIVRVALPYSDANYTIGCPWSTTGYSGVKIGTTTLGTDTGWSSSITNVQPGQVLNFKHTLSTTSLGDMPASVKVANVVVRGMTGTATNNGMASRLFPGSFYPNPPLFTNDYTALTYAQNVRGNKSTIIAKFGNYSGALNGSPQQRAKTIYTVTQDDVGKTLCQRLDWGTPVSSTNSGYGKTSGACATVPYNYNLVPAISATPASSVKLGDTITYTPSVNNLGPTKSKGSTAWNVTKFVLKPSESIPSGGTGSGTPASYYDPSGTRGATTLKSGSTTFNINVTNLAGGTVTVPNLEAGSQICFATSAKPYNHSTTNWRYGAPVCVIVAKSPRVQISGGDVMVGRSIPTPSSTAIIDVGGRGSDAGKTYGSWMEYGAFAPRTSNAASGGALGFNSSRTAGTSSKGQSLTFANNNTGTTCSNSDGCYAASLGSRTNLIAQYSSAPAGYTTVSVAGSSINLSSLTAGKYYYNVAKTLSVSGVLKSGVSVIIVNSAATTVSANIVYTPGPYSSLQAIPQALLLSRGNIAISSTVKEVDAWLYSGGIISTCNAPTTPYTSGLRTKISCDNSQLVVNGPVNAEHLQLRRSYGSDTSQGGLGQSAEEINLRPDAYLWAAGQTTNSDIITTVFTKELPARF